MLFNWKCKVNVVGATAMIVHNGRTASPLDIYSKRMKLITSKRKKTEEDIQELLGIQWEASLYWSDPKQGGIGLYMPVENIQASLLKACKKHKMGPQVSGFVFEETLGFPIITDHHLDWDALKADESNKFVKAVTIQRNKALACRGIFHKWQIIFDFWVDDSIITLDEVKMIITTQASRIGLGVWTPSHPKPGNYGRFLIKELAFTNVHTGEVKKYENPDL